MTHEPIPEIRLPIEGDPDQLVALGTLMDDVRRVAEEGRIRDACDAAGRSSELLLSLGRPDAVLALLKTLEEAVPVERWDRVDRAWILNAKGSALSALGLRSDAVAIFEEMRVLGSEMKDLEISSRAAVSLGVQALLADRYEDARKFFHDGLEATLGANDYAGAATVLLNAAALSVEERKTDAAEEILKLAEEIVRALRDPHMLSTLHGNWGRIAVTRRDFQAAERHFRRALHYARRSGYVGPEVNSLLNLGNVCLDQDHIHSSLRWYRRALAVAQTVSSPPLIEPVHRALSVALHRVNRDRNAAWHMELARDLSKEMGSRHGYASATADLGALAVINGEIEKANALLDEALGLFRELGDTQWEERVLRNLVEAKRAGGDLEGLSRIVDQALELLAPGEHSDRADILTRAAQAWLQHKGRSEQARNYYLRALEEHAAGVGPQGTALQAALAASALAGTGDYEGSLLFYDRAYQTYTREGDRQMSFRVANDRAISLIALKRYDEARRDLRTCAVLAEEGQDRAMALQATMNLAELMSREEKADEAIELFQRAIQLSRELADQGAEAEILGNLGIAFAKAGRSDEARAAFLSAHALAETLREPSSKAAAIGGLANLEFVAGHYSRAATYFGQAVSIARRTGDRVHMLEDLAGLVESLAALGRSKEMEERCLELVDTAQLIGYTDLASEALARSARWYLARGDLDESASLHAASIAVAGAGALEDDAGLLQSLASAVMLMVFQARSEMSGDLDDYFERVLDSMNRQYDGLGEQLREILSMARETAAGGDAEHGRGD